MARAGEVTTRTRVAYLVVVAAAVGALVWYVNRPDWQPLDITRVTGSVDSNMLDVTFVRGVCDSGPRVREVAGDTDGVVVRAEQDQSDCDSVGITETRTLELDERLGTRRLRLEDAQPGARCRVEGATTDPCP